MAARIDILNELQQISPEIASLEVVNVYNVPEGYFDGFADSVMMRIKTEGLSAKEELENLSPLLSGLSKKLPYDAPVGYFRELSDHAVSGVKAIELVNIELENLSPVMSSLKSVNVYQVPAGYFDGLAEDVLAHVKKKPAKVVSMNFGKKVMRYAAAAVVTGLIAIAGWMYFGNNKA